jgi:lipoprotein-anchoring transpeptidase ErfK/SrfK
MLGKPADVSYSVLSAADHRLLVTKALGWQVAGVAGTLTWDGTTPEGRVAAPGAYLVVVRAVDHAGNAASQSTTFTLADKWIRVTLHAQSLSAYQGTSLVLTTPVTTGGPWTPTPPGTFRVLQKISNYVFRSPWPKSSPLWYPDSPTNFALLYNANGGWFLHDAPWRTNFGPGSNALAGTPGGDFTGSHGCTNVPLQPMARLFSWAGTGTLVQIVR